MNFSQRYDEIQLQSVGSIKRKNKLKSRWTPS